MSLFNNEGWTTWDEYFELRDAAAGEVPEEFMAERPLNELFHERKLFDEASNRCAHGSEKNLESHERSDWTH